MTTWPEARSAAHACAPPLKPVRVPLTDATGRVLAEDLISLCALPPFDGAAMDGWAVCGPGPWTVVGRVLAGDPPPPVVLQPGEAVEVATGAVVPDGTEGVLPYEDGSAHGPLLGGAHPGRRHVRRAGEECPKGELLLPAGTRLVPAALGLAAAAGHDEVLVHPAPRVVAVVTGSELLDSGLPSAGRIRDAVGPLLGPALTAYGATVVSLTHVPDRRADLLAAVRDAAADVVVTSGASSIGPMDHLSGVLAELQARIVVNGVAVRPGHPQLLAVLPDGRVVVGLPGNPLAALSGIVTLLAPLLAGLQGAAEPPLASSVARDPLPAGDAHQLLPVHLDRDGVRLTGHGGSAMLRGAALADAFAVVPPHRSVRTGGRVDLLPLP